MRRTVFVTPHATCVHSPNDSVNVATLGHTVAGAEGKSLLYREGQHRRMKFSSMLYFPEPGRCESPQLPGSARYNRSKCKFTVRCQAGLKLRNRRRPLAAAIFNLVDAPGRPLKRLPMRTLKSFSVWGSARVAPGWPIICLSGYSSNPMS